MPAMEVKYRALLSSWRAIREVGGESFSKKTGRWVGPGNMQEATGKRMVCSCLLVCGIRVSMHGGQTREGGKKQASGRKVERKKSVTKIRISGSPPPFRRIVDSRYGTPTS